MTARLTTRDRLLRTVTEASWQRQVEDIARLAGWWTYHAPDNRPVVTRGGRRYVQDVTPGFPDLLCLRDNRALVAELKTETGRVTQQQQAWLAAFRAAGMEAFLWRPRDVDEVQRVLTRGGTV